MNILNTRRRRRRSSSGEWKLVGPETVGMMEADG